MKLIEPYVELLEFSDLYERIEYATRNCYKSHDKSNPESREDFIMDKLERKHFSVLEHSNIPVLWEFSEEEKEDSVYIYEWLQAIKGETDAKLFITLSNDGDYLVLSGNVRAWMDFFEYDFKSSYLFNEGFLDMLETALSKKYSMFFLDRNVIPRGDISIISEKDAFLFDQNHLTLTFEILTDRATTHQIVRHRVFSYAQESQRYCNYSKDKFENEVKFSLEGIEAKYGKEILDYVKNFLEASEKAYLYLTDNKVPPEVARAVLPNATATTLIMTGRFNDFVSFVDKRTVSGAQDSIKKIALAIEEIMGIKVLEYINE